MARTGAGAPPGSNSRGRGGKFRKFTRGGGKHYSRDLRPQDENGNEISMWSEDAQKQFDALSDETNSEDDSEEDSDEPSGQAVSREDRKKEKKARKEAAIARRNAQSVEVGDLPPSDDEEDSDEDMPANPNHSKAARNQTKAVDDVAEDVSKIALNRKERESADAQAAKEKYRALHEQGKTDEAKSDLARLKLIREQREAEAARRKAEKEDKDSQEATRKAELDAKLASIEAKKTGKKLK